MRNLYAFLFGLILFLTSPFQAVSAADYAYTLDWLEPNMHTYVISLEVGADADGMTEFCLPAWRPGRYYFQNYAAAVSHFEAFDGEGKKLAWEKRNKDTWSVQQQNGRIMLRYHFLANQFDAGSSYVGRDQLYINPVNCMMYVKGRLDGSVQLNIPRLPKDWKVATALQQGEMHSRFTAD
ncbi:MAG: hypothetical protein AAF206_06580, partial [Bacteroidota bacterium]